MTCERPTRNKPADQSAKRFSSRGSAGRVPALILVFSFCESRKIIVSSPIQADVSGWSIPIRFGVVKIPSRFGPLTRGLVPGHVRDLLQNLHLHVVAEVVGEVAVGFLF